MSLPQVVAGTMTFAMRYAFKFSFGIVTGECEALMNGEDDDKKKNVLQNIKDEIKDKKPEYINPDKPNANVIAQKFGKKSNKDKILEEARKIVMTIKKDDMNKFKEDIAYYLSIKNSSLELTDIDYEAELDRLMKLEIRIKELNTGAIGINDPDDVNFYLDKVDDTELPVGVKQFK
jgi:phosphoribosyl-ATP pyrophosphohydrolase